MKTRFTYDKKSRNVDDIEAFIDCWPKDEFEQIEVVENGPTITVTCSTGEHRTGFGLTRAEFDAFLRPQIAAARETILEQIKSHKE